MKNLLKSLLTITALLFIFSSCEKDEVDPVDPIFCEIHITDDITENTTWEASCTYYVDQSIDVKDGAILTIEPGTVIKFAQSKELTANYAGSGSTGNIIAVGSKDKMILFTSQSQTPAKGDWLGIWLYQGANASKFKYCKIEYACSHIYSGGSGAISNNGADNLEIDYCSFENNDSYGVLVSNLNQSALSSFTNNVFSDNTTGDLKAYANNISSIGEGNIFATDIIIRGSDVDDSGDVLWRKQNVAYTIIESIKVGCNTGTNLLIEAGASIKFSQGKKIEVAYASNRIGMIKAIGTATDPITFTSSASTPSRGDWECIIFYDGSSTGSVFDYCNFSYGGGSTQYNAMIAFKDNQGPTTTISNCSFSHSEGYGILLASNDDITSLTIPILMDNTFSDNTLGDKNW